jgi:FemAB-related protein (PEP-CTERM system-associated)
MDQDIQVRPLGRGEEKAWDNYVLHSSEASHCHLSGWRRVIAGSYGHASCYLWAHAGGSVKGVLPLISMRSFVFRRALVSMPFLDDGGICADDEHVRAQLSEQALQIYQDQRADILDLRHRRKNKLDIPVNGSKIIMILKLLDNPDAMWKGFDAKLRNQIRKASKSGVTAAWSGKDGLADFYEVFAANMRDLGSPVHSRKFFEAILDEFRDSARIMLVRKGDRIIGGAVCLCFKDTMIVPWASALREYFSLCPNNLVYWEMIRWGCENGYQRFDFGRSSPDSGTYRFKKQWGTIEEPLQWQSVRRNNGHTAIPHADNNKYQWMVGTWKHLPLSFTKLVGPMVRGQVSS